MFMSVHILNWKGYLMLKPLKSSSSSVSVLNSLRIKLPHTFPVSFTLNVTFVSRQICPWPCSVLFITQQSSLWKLVGEHGIFFVTLLYTVRIYWWTLAKVFGNNFSPLVIQASTRSASLNAWFPPSGCKYFVVPPGITARAAFVL